MRLSRFAIATLALGLWTTTGAVAADRPDPSHITFTPPKDVNWRMGKGSDQAVMFGDPNKPGIYGLLIRWHPNSFSKPHFHSTDRYIYVVSGTFWVSSSDIDDPATLYSMPAGSVVTDLANTVHWDGAKDDGALLELVGMGPVITKSAQK
jgi:quercetin dioxygenase-like cupin family protein